MKSFNNSRLHASNLSRIHSTIHQYGADTSSVQQTHGKVQVNYPSILIVEDNLVNQTITVNQLVGLGYGTDVATNGQEALEALGPISEWDGGTPPYQLIFMDCNMPVMDGYEATRQIRQLEAQAHAMYDSTGELSAPKGEAVKAREDESPGPQQMPKIVIVALTANVMATDRVRAFSVGMDDYLTKPVATSVLKQTLDRWLTKVSSPEASYLETSSPVMPPEVIASSSLLPTLGSPLNSSDDLMSEPLQNSDASPPNKAPSSPLHKQPLMAPVLVQDSIASTMSQPSSHNQPYSRPSEQLPDPSVRQHLSQNSIEMGEPVLSHIDWSYLHTLSDEDHDFEMTLLELFLQDCQEQLKQLKEAIAQSNIKQIEKNSHYIKGASANVGAQYMQHYARQIEQQVRHTQLTCLDGEMSRLETSFSIVQEIFAAQQEAR